MSEQVKVLMICLGNICRSPTAEGVFRKLVEARNLGKIITVDSAGTGDWHVGSPPDTRSAKAAAKRGYQLEEMRGRQVSPQDFEDFDYIIAMDKSNFLSLKRACPQEFRQKLSLLLSHGKSDYLEVPDPYYSGSDGFELVLDLIEEAAGSLLDHIQAQHKLG